MSEAEDITALLRRIFEQQREAVGARVDAIDAALVAAAAGTLADEEREAARRDAHTLAGSLGTFGLPAASDLARELERALKAGVPPAGADALAGVAAALRAEVERGPAT